MMPFQQSGIYSNNIPLNNTYTENTSFIATTAIIRFIKMNIYIKFIPRFNCKMYL